VLSAAVAVFESPNDVVHNLFIVCITSGRECGFADYIWIIGC